MEKLPVTFRINSSEINHEALSEMLRHPKFVEEMANQKSVDGDFEEVSMAHDKKGEVELRTVQLDYTKLKLDCKSYYPNNLVFEMMI